MRRYLDTARRYRWVIAIVLALTWGSGAALAYSEYVTSFEADATIWTERQSQQFAPISPQDPGLSSLVSPAQEQAGVMMQLLQTRSFLREIVLRTSIRRPDSVDESKFLADITKRFRVDVLGSNLFRLAYRANDPRTGGEMVVAALAVREDHLAASRLAATEAAATYYRAQLGVAENQALEAQRDLDAFDKDHRPPLSTPDEYNQRQLRLKVEETKARVTDMKVRIDQSSVLPSILQVADALDFQVVDKPLDEVKPSGGTRTAVVIAGGAFVAGLALVGVLLIVGTVLAGGMAGEAGIARLAPASLFATVPEIANGRGAASRDVRSALASATFRPPDVEEADERDG
jgi:uncharacterized protein involved in exopolysaccharide biosynthesis